MPNFMITPSVAGSVERRLDAGGSFVQVQPSPLDIAAYRVNLAVLRIAITRAQLVERRNEAVGFLILTLPLRENLLARGIFQIVDAGFVDIDLEQQLARLVRRLRTSPARCSEDVKELVWAASAPCVPRLREGRPFETAAARLPQDEGFHSWHQQLASC